MGIFIFIVLLWSDLIVLLACGYEYKKYNQYKDGMILGVHVPKEALEQEEVKLLCEKECRQRTIFQRVNHILNVAVCLLCMFRIELGIMLWVVWLMEYLIGLERITKGAHKTMYRLKIQNQWFQESTKQLIRMDTEEVWVDEDVYWKNGYYNNPKDSRLLVPGRISGTNYTFNMGRRAGRVICGGGLILLAGVLGWMMWIMFSLLTMKVTFTIRTSQEVVNGTNPSHTEDHTFRFSAAGYTCEFTSSEILSVQLLEELPDERFSKINGGATERYDVGHFRGKETGKTMLFLWEGYVPILKVELSDETVFANSKEPGEAESWYEVLVDVIEEEDSE